MDRPVCFICTGFAGVVMQARKPRAVVREDSESLAVARELLQSGSSDDHKVN